MASRSPQESPNNLLEFARTANAGVPKRRSAPPSQRPAPVAVSGVSGVSAAEAVAPAVEPIVPSAPPAPLSVAPQVRTIEVPVVEARRGGGLLVALVGVTGLVVSLYRNDLLPALSHSAGLDAQYARVEHALGSPSFGTPRSLDALVYVPPVAEAPAAPSNPAEPTPTAAVEARETGATAAAARPPDVEAKPRAGVPRKSMAIASKRASPAAKPEAKEASAISLEEEPVKDAPAEKHSAKKKDKEAAATADAPPALSLDDAIKASMKKK